MALISFDAFGFIEDIRRDTKLFQWVSLIFQMVLSSLVTFCGVVGGCLVAHSSVAIAIGSGLCAVATVLATFFAASPLTRGMMLVRPEKLAEVQIHSDMAITRKS